MITLLLFRTRGVAKRASLSEANLTVLYRNFMFTFFTDSLKIHQTMRTSILIRMRADPRTRHGWDCGGSKSHRSIGFFMFFMCALGDPDTDYPRDADCVLGAYFPRRKARREVPPPPSNYY